MAKRARPCAPDELEVGSVVIYDNTKKGIVKDAFGPLDQFWVKDCETDDVVRHSDGDMRTFSASQLQLAPEQPLAKVAAMGAAGQAGSMVATAAVAESAPKMSARVLIIGTEYQMLQIIEHFGPPDGAVRREPQMLLAVPCSSCRCGPACERFDRNKLQTCNMATCPLNELAAGGIDEGMLQLAQNLRPDLGGRLGIRAYHIKQAMEQLGPDLAQLDDYYVLSAVTLPFGWSTIEANLGERRRTMQDVRCQIDLGATAEGECIEGETSLERTAMRVLGEACGIRMNEPVWEEEVQYRLRKLLSVDIPLKYWDGPTAKGFVLILPSDLRVSNEGGLLTFREPSAAALGPAQMLAPTGSVVVQGGGGDQQQVGGRSVAEWKAEQFHLFGHLPKLPMDWIRIKSRSSGEVYFWNTKTQTPQYDHPLPEGWTKQRSKSSGKVYYFNSEKRQSVYVPPTEP